MAIKTLLRSQITKISGHHFRFSVRGMSGDFDVPIPGIEAAPKGPSPKEMLLASMCACTGTDVIDLLAKFKVEYANLSLEAKAEVTNTHPKVFGKVDLTYEINAPVGDTAMILEAVKRSTHQYSSVTAIVAKTCPVFYRVKVDGQIIGEGQADFTNPHPPASLPGK